ncbi:MAG: hypothetical protein ACRDS9_22210 [Pseudonocardiaceae bacterium]
MADSVPRIIGHGFPQYGDKLFTGYDQRWVLGHGETVTSTSKAAWPNTWCSWPTHAASRRPRV